MPGELSDSLFRSSEQRLFSQIIERHMLQPDAPLLLEGTTGLGKTRAMLAAVALTDKPVALVLPTHALIDQLLASSDLAAVGLSVADFRPRAMFATEADYQAQRQLAQDARVMVCTAASVIIDQRLGGEYNGAVERAVLVFDEADQLPDMAALQSDFMIPAAALVGQGLKPGLMAIAEAGRKVEPEIRAAAKVMLEILEEPVGYAHVGVDDEGNAKLFHFLPGRLLKKIANRPSSIFVSATLSVRDKMDDFQNSMGIAGISILSRSIEPASHGKVRFYVEPYEVGTDEWFDAIVALARTAEKPVLVATTSHDLTQRLQVAMGEQDGILIKAAAWAGLDLPQPPRTVIVPQVPFSQPVVLDGEVRSSYLNARHTAERRLKQVLGRGLRSPDAVVTMAILDGRVDRLSEFVPKRFKSEWPEIEFDEGGRVLIVLSKAERDPALRKAALRHYGTSCMHEGCDVTQPHRLDVHHLDPVSEGQRRTTLKDVVVLCKNHHADAHLALRQAKKSGTALVKFDVTS